MNCTEQIVAKYTQQKTTHSLNAKTNGMRLNLIMATNTKEIVDKYTQNGHKVLAKSRSSSLSSASTVFDAFSRLSIRDKWTLWHYECGDFPVHINCGDPCQFCLELFKHRILFKNASCESKDRWDSYLERGKSFDFDANAQTLLTDELTDFLPSKLAKQISFNRKLGVAVFRDGIVPKNECAQNSAGGVFQLLLFASSGQRSASLLHKIDQLFLQSLRMILNSSIGCHVNGLFIRLKIDTKEEQKEYEGETEQKTDQPKKNPWDIHDLPIIAMLEIWIGDQQNKSQVRQSLIKDINEMITKLEIPYHLFRNFSFNIRMRNDSYFENPFTANQRECSLNTFEALKSQNFI